MATNNVTMFPQVNWQALCEALSAQLLRQEARYTNQDSLRLDELDAADQKSKALEQRMALLESQNQELVRLQAEAAISNQAEATLAKSEIERLQVQAGAATASATRTRRWRRAFFTVVPTAACASMVATFYYHAAIQSALSAILSQF